MKNLLLFFLTTMLVSACADELITDAFQDFNRLGGRHGKEPWQNLKAEPDKGKAKSLIESSNDFQAKCDGPLVMPLMPTRPQKEDASVLALTTISTHNYSLPTGLGMYLNPKERCGEIKNAFSGSYWRLQEWHQPQTKIELSVSLDFNEMKKVLAGGRIKTSAVQADLEYGNHRSWAFKSLDISCPGQFNVSCDAYNYGFGFERLNCKKFNIVADSQICHFAEDELPFFFSDNAQLGLKIFGQIHLDPLNMQMVINKISWNEI